MLKIYELDEALATILKRKPIDEFPVSEAMRARTKTVFGEDLEPAEVVRRILKDVRNRGDAALIEWTHKLDGVKLKADQIEVDAEALTSAYDLIDSEVTVAMERAAERIEKFHLHNPAPNWWNTSLGGVMGQLIRPLQRVGIYIPGGTAPLCSTLLMTAIVARSAGVEEIVICSPPQKGSRAPHPAILAAAGIADVDEVYALGGVPAIGAMAYGTDTVARVDKICGPGNAFVVLAKKEVFGVVGIDSLPGPTETVVVADDSANAEWIAADLMAQAEHTAGTALLITPSKALADKVNAAFPALLAGLPVENRREIEDSFKTRSGIVLTEDLLEAVALGDDFAPEHFCLSVADPWAWVDKIRNAGGVFVGEHSFEVLGDYVAGPSHQMPTGGTARFTSACNVLDFMRVTNVIALDATTSKQLAPLAVKIAETEGLHAHALAARLRTRS